MFLKFCFIYPMIRIHLVRVKIHFFCISKFQVANDFEVNKKIVDITFIIYLLFLGILYCKHLAMYNIQNGNGNQLGTMTTTTAW